MLHLQVQHAASISKQNVMTASSINTLLLNTKLNRKSDRPSIKLLLAC
jgi:hypothetical protein